MKRTTKKFASKVLALALAALIAVPNMMAPAFAAELDDAAGDPAVNIEVVTVDTAAGAETESDTNGEAGEAETDDAGGPSDSEASDADASEDVGDGADAGQDGDTDADAAETDVPDVDADADAGTDIDADADAGTDIDADAGDGEGETEDEPDAGTGDEAEKPWESMDDTKRPGASDDVTHDVGTSEDKISGADKNWDIFYDADRDVYKVTFNIGSGAQGTQTIDLTQALELLGQYANSGKQELQDAIDALEKPVKGEPGIDEPVKEEIPDEPEAPPAPDGFEMEEPVAPVEPAEPGKPEGMDEALDGAYEDLMAQIKTDPNSGEPIGLETFDVKQFLADRGMPTDDAYTAQYAKYLNNKAYCEWVDTNWASWEQDDRFGFVSYFGDKDTLLFYGLGISVKFEGGANGTPIVNEPEYKVDKNSEAYKAYLAAMEAYEGDKAAYEAEKAGYDAAFEAWMAAHGPDSEEGKAYAEAVAEYEALKAEWEARVAEIEENYKAAKAEYDAKLAELDAKYEGDKAAYDAAVKQLKEDFDRRVNADVVEPGDVKKFELFITSDSKHTYMYKTGSFTLATPDWSGEGGSGTIGFDGQDLPDRYVDHAQYWVSNAAKPIQDMFLAIGMADPSHPNNKWNINGNGEVSLDKDGLGNIQGYQSYWTNDIIEFLSQYGGETMAEKLDNYLLAYYGGEYETIDELVKNNAEAREALTKTESDGNKWFKIGDDTFVVDAHLDTVKYDNFYQQLFSFAFGSEADIDEVTGGMKWNPHTNRFEYDNKSWTTEAADGEALKALYYYMDHKEIWQQTDAYFNALLDGGLTSEQATWTSLMMALNISGFGTGNDWQDTEWPWYSSIQLEQMDIDFNLKKTDGETGETITSSETEFQVWYIDKVKNEDGTESDVKMYCTQTTDDEGNISYTFVTDPNASVWTENGELKIDYAMMKDIVYYLQEMTAPEGYERDTNVYIVMSQEDYDKLLPEDKAALEGTFDKFLDMAVSDDGLTVNIDFVNVKIVPAEPDPEPETPEEPDPTPDPDPDPDPDPTLDPDPDPDPDPTPDPDPEEPDEEIPEEPTPLDPGPEPEDPEEPEVEIPEEDVPLTDTPEEEVPEEEVEIPDEDIPLSDIPQTGDENNMGLMAMLAILSCMGLVGLAATGKRKDA